MRCQEITCAVKTYNSRNKRNVFMNSTAPKHGDILIASGKSKRNVEEILKLDCVLAYNNAKKGVEVSDQMSS